MINVVYIGDVKVRHTASAMQGTVTNARTTDVTVRGKRGSIA